MLHTATHTHSQPHTVAYQTKQNKMKKATAKEKRNKTNPNQVGTVTIIQNDMKVKPISDIYFVLCRKTCANSIYQRLLFAIFFDTHREKPIHA